MSLQFVNKKGEVLRLVKPYRNKPYRKKVYTFSIQVHAGVITDSVLAINTSTAYFKYILRHPIVLFRLE